MRKTLSLVLMIAAGLAGCHKPAKDDPFAHFDPNAFDVDSNNIWMSNVQWKGLPAGSKVAITEFVVEYVTGTTRGSGGADQLLGMNKSKSVFSERFKERFPTTLYNEFVTALQGQGFTVVPMADITKNPALRFWELQPESGVENDEDNKNASEIQTYHVRGLPVARTTAGIFNSDDTLKAEMQAVVETGATAALHVHIRVGLDGQAHAFLNAGSTIQMMADPSQKTTGWAHNKQIYQMQRNATLISTTPLRDEYPVIVNQEYKAFEGSVYTIDSAAYQQAIERLYPNFAKMAAEAVRGQ